MACYVMKILQQQQQQSLPTLPLWAMGVTEWLDQTPKQSEEELQHANTIQPILKTPKERSPILGIYLLTFLGYNQEN